MLALTENKSKIWFKILNHDYSTIDGSWENWLIPSREKKGELTYFEGSCYMKKRDDDSWLKDRTKKGLTWLISNPKMYYQVNSGQRIFIAQLMDIPEIEEPGIIWVKRTRLLREATSLDLKPFGIYRAFTQTI